MSPSNENYFDALNFDRTFERIFHVFRERWIAFTLISFAMYALGWVFAILLSLVLGNDINIDGFSNNYMLMYELQDWKQSTFYFVEALLYYVFSCIAHGAAIWCTIHFYLQQQQPRVIDSFKVSGRKCWPLVATTFLKMLLMFVPLLVPMVLLYIFAVQGILQSRLAIAWVSVIVLLYGYFVKVVMFAVYAVVMVEGKGPLKSIERSFELTRGYWAHILGILLVWGVVKVVVSSMVASFAYQGMMTGHVYLIYLSKILDTIAGIFFLAIIPVFEGVIYVSLRVEKESIDSEKLSKEIGSSIDEEASYVNMVPDSNKKSADLEVAEKEPSGVVA